MANALPQLIKDLRHPRVYDPQEYVSQWTEEEVLDGHEVEAWVLILRTKGCYWARRSGCSMCGYVNDTFTDVKHEDLMHQWEAALHHYRGQPMIKIYNSGNFFDASEIPLKARRRILEDVGQRAEKLVVENLPQMVKKEWVEEAVSLVPRFEVAIGLETASDEIRDRCISKDFHFDWYVRACRTAHAAGATVKTYLLMKPPFLTEAAAIEDMVDSARRVEELTDVLSINPMNIQRDTVVDRLFHTHEYRPPWLWSVVEVLKALRGYRHRINCKPTAGGMARGAHNCGGCDPALLRAIQDYSLQRRDTLDELGCQCQARWRAYVEAQDLIGSSIDLEAFVST